MGFELNLVNLMDVLQEVTEVDSLGLQLGVPRHELDKIWQDFWQETEERKRAMLKWWLDNDLNCTWEKVISALRANYNPDLADEVAQVSKRQTSKTGEENLNKVGKLEETQGLEVLGLYTLYILDLVPIALSITLNYVQTLRI